MVEIAKLKIAPAYQVVSEELQKLIVGGQLKPGEQLPSETELATQFGVNRSTVREGIRQLESEGLLRREGRKRLLITVPTGQDISPRLERALLLNDVRFSDLWEVARVLEPLSVSLLAGKITGEQLDALDANIEAMAKAVAAKKPADKLDTEFHTMLASFTGNRALVLAREPIGQLLFRPYVEIGRQLKQAPLRNLEAHRAIVKALRGGDGDEAVAWMERHLEDLHRGWLMAGRAFEDSIGQHQ
ncbi:transcriptional regulator [Zhengella mangrovi]|uniref:Transcriptional regulator n=1 Tax=Zhengella mangrovi TaxID=1982044 RepID=A0A2G1QQP5_9HYPH|nr:FCD domain-containing protein [Zhengella mangrovi]PHP67780.1 transcriptional regulator [Zhengella mangrovi]